MWGDPAVDSLVPGIGSASLVNEEATFTNVKQT